MDVVRATCPTTGQKEEIFLSPLSQLFLSTDLSLSMFQLEEIQSQGDTDFQLASDSVAKPSTCNQSPLISGDLEEFKFLDSIIESSETDWQNINISMESTEESLHFSQLMDFNSSFSSEIPLEEQSYNLNSISAVASDLEFWSVPGSDQVVLQLLTSSSIEDSSVIEEDMPLNKNAENLNATETLSIEETSSTVAFSDSDSNENLTHVAGKKYLEMRRKNNIASQRSRKIRKLKNVEMTHSLKKLEKENKDLLLQAQKLEKERDALKTRLMAILSRK